MDTIIGHAAVGRNPVFKGVQQETEALLGLFGCKSQRLEHSLLHIALEDSHAAITE